MRKHVLSTGLVALFHALAVAQTTIYVDAAAAPGGDGSSASPLQRIQDGIVAAVTGDTVLVAPGVYDENVSIGKRIDVRSSGGPLVTAIRPATAQDTVRVPTVGGLTPPKLEGFTLYIQPGHSAFSSHFAAISRCILIGDGSSGSIGIAAGSDIWADHCTVHGFRFGATGTLHGAFVHVSNSIVFGNVFDLGEIAQPSFSWYASHYSGPSGFGPPHFFDAPGHDFHLLASSGCIDAGDPNAPLDPDGTRADMGAIPFDASYAPFSVYCTAKINSLGCVPSIAATHNASFSSDRPFWITCSNQLNQKIGFFFYGFAPKNTPYQGGFRCVQSPTRRSGLLGSGGNVGVNDCSGEFAFDFNERIRSGADLELVPGVEVFAQYWSRDPAASFFNNRSDALRFPIQP